jgi:hypothetical protein
MPDFPPPALRNTHGEKKAETDEAAEARIAKACNAICETDGGGDKTAACDQCRNEQDGKFRSWRSAAAYCNNAQMQARKAATAYEALGISFGATGGLATAALSGAATGSDLSTGTKVGLGIGIGAGAVATALGVYYLTRAATSREAFSASVIALSALPGPAKYPNHEAWEADMRSDENWQKCGTVISAWAAGYANADKALADSLKSAASAAASASAAPSGSASASPSAAPSASAAASASAAPSASALAAPSASVAPRR